MNALFLHRVFGYRGVILFPWLARVFDRCDGRSNTLPPLIRSTKTSQSNIHEIRAKTVTYYQVLIDNRDMPHIRAQTEAVTFLGNQERDRNLYAIPGLDYVAHEDVIPYTSTERTPIEHELFDKFLLHDSEATPNFVPREYLKSWQERHHHWLELSDVAKDVTHQIRVTVIPFYMGSRSAHGVTVHWWRYSIRIENLNPDEPVTLRERHWRIFSLSGTLETVRGKGVVGHEPRLSKEYPAFQYSSHISLSAPSGHMWGTFKMERDDGTFIEVRIPPFNLESLKGVAWITGRSTRKWYRQLPPEKRSIFIQHLDRHKYKYMGIVGAIGAAFSIHYYTHLETSPITGRRRFMLMNAEQLTIMSDLEKEKIATMFSNQMLPENSKQTQLVARVAKQIIGANMDIDSIRNIKWSVRVVDTDIKNAIFGAFIIWAIFPTDWTSFWVNYIFENFITFTSRLPYSRLLEEEADEIGLMLAAKACFDVRESVSFWKAVHIAEANHEVPEFISTHPASARRAETLNEKLPWALDIRRQCNCSPLPEHKPVGKLNLPKHSDEKIMEPLPKRAGGIHHIPVIETVTNE
ncbi:unnamed protein product [Rotaria sp. Silwood1]|nr:unnamed protein product [Rotaria sp. Silwood1]CAF0958219.1 unnamed protein product [Rotaria sp. Silwood1]CAF4521550.1 unnamed protein product [Rotaria sp. Silwood1]CAF4602339.1 unnamed protein product [Rotaria sp. Silwood1]